MSSFTLNRIKYQKKFTNSDKIINFLIREFGTIETNNIIEKTLVKKGKILLNPYNISTLKYFIISENTKISKASVRKLDKRYMILSPYLKHWERFSKESDSLPAKSFECINEYLWNTNLINYANKYNINTSTAEGHLIKSMRRLKSPARIKAYNSFVKHYIIKGQTKKPNSPIDLETVDFIIEEQIKKSKEKGVYQSFEEIYFSQKIKNTLAIFEINSWEKLLSFSENDFLKQRLFGKKALEELKYTLSKFGFQLSKTDYLTKLN